MTPRDALEKAISLAGGQTALAEKCTTVHSKPIKQGHIWNWLNRDGGRVPSELVLAVAAGVDWQVSPHQLRPDLYPNEADALPGGLAATDAA